HHLGDPRAKGSLRRRMESLAGRRREELARRRVALERDVASREAELVQATKGLLLFPEEHKADALAVLDAMKRGAEDARAKLPAVVDEERKTRRVDQGKVDEALALVAELPRLLAGADRGKLRDALASLVEEVSVRYAPAGTARERRSRRKLDGVDVTLTP